MAPGLMQRAFAPLAFASCVLSGALLSSCAAPGEPTPPQPVIPVAIADLAARQAGAAILLSFTLPRESTHHEALAEMPAIEIYRATLPPAAAPDRNTSWRLAYTIPAERADSYMRGPVVEFRDPLAPEDFAAAAGSALAYKVRTRASKSRASDDSNLVVARIHPAPGAPSDLHAMVTESAMVLSWSGLTPPATGVLTGYRVYRAGLEPGEETAAQSPSKPKSPAVMVGTVSSPTFRDSDFEFGRTYVYTVRAVAQFGPDVVESDDSAPVVVTPRDVFPPAAPTGLEGAVVPATPQAPVRVELSWAISPEADLAGYRVYGSDRVDSNGDRLNAELLASPAYDDDSVMPGGHYFYRVSAVDRAGNESPLSPPVEIEIPPNGP